jgi:TRAP-type C4-dicarboxylate transport system substrate-binding protein
VGWVRFFSNEAMLRPADLKRMKVFTWAGDPNQTDIMKAAGFNPVPLETDYILTSLQTGQINVVPTPPLIASAGQFYGKTKHMLEINYAPLVGGTVITKRRGIPFRREPRTRFERPPRKPAIPSNRKAAWKAIKP